MEGYGTSSYGDGFADVYDDWYQGVTDTDACVAALAALAPAGARVLELGTGTGRLAIPLAARGFSVVGLDSSRGHGGAPGGQAGGRPGAGGGG